MLDLYDELRSLVAPPRATVDIDLVVLSQSLIDLKELARQLGFVMEADPLRFLGGQIEIHRLSKPDPESEDFISLDLRVVTSALREAWDTRQAVEWEAMPMQVLSRSGLAQLKSLRNSGQDRDDIARLQEDADDA